MPEILNHFVRNIWWKIIFQKGLHAKLGAKELLVNQAESRNKNVLSSPEDLNTGKLGKLIRYLIKK